MLMPCRQCGQFPEESPVLQDTSVGATAITNQGSLGRPCTQTHNPCQVKQHCTTTGWTEQGEQTFATVVEPTSGYPLLQIPLIDWQ